MLSTEYSSFFINVLLSFRLSASEWRNLTSATQQVGYPFALKIMEKNTKFSEVAAQWKADKKQYVKKSTYAAYSLLIQSHLIPELGERTDIREIPMTRDLLTLVRPLKKIVRGDFYVLTNAADPTEPRTYRTYFNKLQQQLGLPKMRFHGLPQPRQFFYNYLHNSKTDAIFAINRRKM